MVAWFALETYRFLGMFTTSVLIWPESLFVLPILIGAIDILITELIYLYWVLTRPIRRRARAPCRPRVE